MEGSIFLVLLLCVFMACLPIEWTRGNKLFVGVIMIYIMGFLLELIRAKIQKPFHQKEEYVSYANIIR